MSGHWRIDPSEIGKHDHFVIETDEGRRLALNDARRFGSLDLVRTDELDEWPPFEALGPEPLDLDARELKRRLAGRTAPIKLLLLDQRIVAGLGNIYVCEALYRAGSTRSAPAAASRSSGSKRLVPAIHDVLAEAIAAGGSTLARFRRARRRARLFLRRALPSMAAKGGPAPAAGRSGEWSRAAARHSIVLGASVDLKPLSE